MKHLSERERLSRLFPVLAFEPEQQLFYLEPSALGFGFLCWPLSGGDHKVFDRLNGLMNLDWPTGALLQFCLWTSPDLVTERLLISEDDGIPDSLRRLRQGRAEFLRQAGSQPLDGSLLLRDIQLIVTARLPLSQDFPREADEEYAVQLKQAAQETLKTCGFRARVLTASDYIRVMETILNWDEAAWWRRESFSEFDPGQLIRDQLADYTTDLRVFRDQLRLGPKVVKLLSPKRLPELTHPGMADHYLSEPLTGSRGIREPVLISAGVYFPDTERLRGKLEKERQWATNQAYGPLLKFAPRLGKKKESYDVLFEALDRGDRLVKTFLSAALFCDRDRASSAVAALQTFWREIGLQMLEDRYICLPLLFNCLPFGAEPEVVKELHRYRTMGSHQALVFLPVFADWKGTDTPVMQFVSRDGQLMNFDLFDSPTNYNAVIAAQSGSGKSFLTNEFITQYLSTGGRVWVLDIGRSYEKLADMLDGTFMVFDAESRICLNPFPLVLDFDQETDMLAELLAAMAAPTVPLTDFQNSGLRRVLNQMWRQEGRDLSLDGLAAALKAESDPRLQDIGEQLYPFTSQGEYGRFFNGPNTVNFEGDFIVLELEELRGRKHLQQVVLLQLIYQIQQAMFLGERGRRKVVVIDEAWDLLTQGNTAKFIESGFRRFRKYGGAAIVVTQSINDLYNSSGGEAIAENSAIKILLGQTSETIARLEETRRLDLGGEYGYALLKTLHTVPGRYSELCLVTESGLGVGRLYVEPYKKLLYSTRATDVQAIKNLQNQGLGLMEAIETLLAQPQQS